MGNPELLSEFTAKLDEFAKFQKYIDKAKSQEGKFAAKVIEKVISTNTTKRDDTMSDIVMLIGDIDEVIEGLTQAKDDVEASRGTAGEELEELELRVMIGELEEDEFDEIAAELKESLASIDDKVKAFDDELVGYVEQKDRWEQTARAAGLYEEPEPEPEPEPESEPIQESTSIGQVEDVSAVFDDDDDDDLGLGGGDFNMDDEEEPSDDIIEELAEEPADDEAAVNRRAVLIYQEGTAEEMIHPLSGDELTLGRGRDNGVQVKNDSKVSRYHCKVYRRGPNFYVEDNKSANGSLVNGELITERRLFGGEEIIIGETFFRFRILD